MTKKFLILAGMLLFMPVFCFGQSGNWALEFDGVNDYISIPDDESLDFGTGDFSVEFEVKVKDLGLDGYILGKQNTTTEIGFYFRANNYAGGKFDFVITEPLSSSFSSTQNWTKLKGVREGDITKLYVNDELKATTSVEIVNVNNTNDLTLGGIPEWNWWFKGLIDEVKIYKETTLVGYWNFEEGDGNIVYDKSGNGNNGEIFGATWFRNSGIILELPETSIGSTTDIIGGLIDAIGPFIWAFIGIPLGFIVVKRIIAILPR